MEKRSKNLIQTYTCSLQLALTTTKHKLERSKVCPKTHHAKFTRTIYLQLKTKETWRERVSNLILTATNTGVFDFFNAILQRTKASVFPPYTESHSYHKLKWFSLTQIFWRLSFLSIEYYFNQKMNTISWEFRQWNLSNLSPTAFQAFLLLNLQSTTNLTKWKRVLNAVVVFSQTAKLFLTICDASNSWFLTGAITSNGLFLKCCNLSTAFHFHFICTSLRKDK